jgi:hypothetical protein
VLKDPLALAELRCIQPRRPTIVLGRDSAAVAYKGRAVWVTNNGTVPYAVKSMCKGYTPGVTVIECKEEGACLACVALGRGVWS